MSEQKQAEVLTTPTDAVTKPENAAPKSTKRNLNEKKEEKALEKTELKKEKKTNNKRRMAVVLSSESDVEEAKPIKRNNYSFNVISTAEVVGMPNAVVGKFGYTDMPDKAWKQFQPTDSSDTSCDVDGLDETESEGTGTTLEETGNIYDADDFLDKLQVQHDHVYEQVQSIIAMENKMRKKHKTLQDQLEIVQDKNKLKEIVTKKLRLIFNIYEQSYDDIKFFLA